MATDVTGTGFELRKVIMKFTRAPSGGVVEDADYIGWNIGKVSGASFDSNWTPANYTSVEDALKTWWQAIRGNWRGFTIADSFRWYLAGPAWQPTGGPDPSNPPVRVTAYGFAGTSSGGPVMSPQTAITVTKIVSVRKRWGRIYLPGGMLTSVADNDGRIASATQTALLSAAVAFANTCRAAGLRPVVWSRGKDAYTTIKGNAIPAHPPTAYEITDLQVDNLFDVIRSRRYSTPTVRSRTLLT